MQGLCEEVEGGRFRNRGQRTSGTGLFVQIG